MVPGCGAVPVHGGDHEMALHSGGRTVELLDSSTTSGPLILDEQAVRGAAGA
jgi:hypothetical protein